MIASSVFAASAQRISIKATASSTLKSSTYARYDAAKAIDGDITTPWVEGATGLGIGEWIRLDFSKTEKINRISIVNGYNYTAQDKTGDRFYKNGRVKTAILEFSDGTRRRMTLQDTKGWQSFDLGGTETKSIKIIIESAYKGST